jgi:Tol biopolymer transport system component
VLLHRAVASPAWSPAGAQIAFEQQAGSRVELLTYDVATHALRMVERHAGSVGPLAWSPDGRWLAFTEPGEIRAVRVVDGRERPITRSYVQRIDGLTWRR